MTRENGGILIVGASGFLGRELMKALSSKGPIGTCYRNQSEKLAYLDLTDANQIENLLSGFKPEVILYSAGLTSVDACERDPSLARRLNTDAPASLSMHSATRTIYFSSDYVFDGMRGRRQERDIPRPISEYGRSKLEGEQAVLAANPKNAVIRVSGLYTVAGTRDRKFESEQNETITAEDTRLSAPVHVDDVVGAVSILLRSDIGGVFHAAGPDALSRYEFESLVSLRHSRKQRIIPTDVAMDRQAARPRDSSLQSVKLNALGWNPRPVCDVFRPIDRTRLQVSERHKQRSTRARPVCAILLDCIGAVLAQRTWQDDEVAKRLDLVCSEKSSTTARLIAAGILENRDAHETVDLVVNRYVPNSPVWHQLLDWRSRYRLALVNNGPAATFHKWRTKYGLDGVFDVLLNSEECGIQKSNPAFFAHAADLLGIPANRCLLLDDDPRNLSSAQRCGMMSCRTVEHKHYPTSEFLFGGLNQ